MYGKQETAALQFGNESRQGRRGFCCRQGPQQQQHFTEKQRAPRAPPASLQLDGGVVKPGLREGGAAAGRVPHRRPHLVVLSAHRPPGRVGQRGLPRLLVVCSDSSSIWRAAPSAMASNHPPAISPPTHTSKTPRETTVAPPACPPATCCRRPPAGTPASTASTSSSGQTLMPTGAWNTSRFSPIAFSTTRGGGMILRVRGGGGGGGLDTDERWLPTATPAIDSTLHPPPTTHCGPSAHIRTHQRSATSPPLLPP